MGGLDRRSSPSRTSSAPTAGTARPAYQEILPLRTNNSDGATIIVEGVDEGYRAASFLV